MNASIRLLKVLAAVAALLSQDALAQDADRVRIGESVERHLPSDETFAEWVYDANYLDEDQSDSLETQEVATEVLETIKLTDLVPPIRFESGIAEIPDETVAALRDLLIEMQDRRNVRLHLVGHADDQPLSTELAEIFGDNEGLSRERAGEVAEFLQRELELPPEAVSYQWAGDTMPVASNESAEGRSQNRRVEVEIWYDEAEEGVAFEEFLVEGDVRRIKVCRTEIVCKLSYLDGHAQRARVKNLIAPLHFDEDGIEVPDRFIASIEQALDDMADRSNVVIGFVGFTDDIPLTGRTERIYGSHLGLSRARARRVAIAVQEALDLPTTAIESEGRGAENPLQSNGTARGRALNRRVEVEFWYDDPLKELPNEPQLCPAEPGDAIVTRTYDPPWGEIPAIEIIGGAPRVPAGLIANLERAMADIQGRSNVRLRFVGYTSNERLERRTAIAYGDDIGLSAARARRTMETVAAEMNLAGQQVEYEGHGYVHSDDVVNTGFVQGETSHVEVRVVYDELAQLDDYDGVDTTRLQRELEPRDPFGLNMMRITVDGKPIDDPQRSSADIQRCTDVALDDAEIAFGFDNLRASPRLSVSAQPTTVSFDGSAESLSASSTIRFSMYSNYTHFIERAEIRIFDQDQSTRADPLDVVTIDARGISEWRPPIERFQAPRRELKYVLRAYGPDGAFDETSAQPLWLVYEKSVAEDENRSVERRSGPDELAVDSVLMDEVGNVVKPVQIATGALLAGYGENELAVRNIAISSGTVRVRGGDIPAGHGVWVAGQQVPVDTAGNFVAETILPTGKHTVEVAVLDPDGNGELFLRDLEFRQNDWFYVGMADVTLSANDSRGPVDLLQGGDPAVDLDESAYGRLAFFVDGRFGTQWKMSASADTREGPVDELFSNFMSKSPESLFRRIDPDYHYPTFGDDGTVQEIAPTQGKFFARLDRGPNYGTWGNFNVGYMNNELAQIDRGLYGGMLHYESESFTGFGERRFAADAFTAEPGTVPSREEFRGTGGSLYFLRRQDILTGSERVRIEIRDKASGIVTGVVQLRPVLDYDIDYLQGRILLAEPLTSTVDEDLLVRTSALDGDEAYLVVRYEYTPGFDDIDALSVGGQAHFWLNDYVGVGLTTNSNEQGDIDSRIDGADLTLRKSEQTWLKLQTGQTEGFLTDTTRSNDGGFEFTSVDNLAFVSADARAERADVSIGLADFFENQRGQLTLYEQNLDAGYAAPGLATLTATRNSGGSFSMHITDSVTVAAKRDERVQELGVETEATEIDLGWQITDRWDVRTGIRNDERRDNSPIVPLTQELGERRDVIVQVGYDSLSRWRAYGFSQDTREITGSREENGRVGAGAAYQVTDRLGLDLELSNGDLGEGGRIGTDYIHSDRTSLYLNYALENERTDNSFLSSRGSEGTLVAGAKSRFSDSASIFVEERYRQNDVLTGLTHSTGISYAPTDRLNLGANTDIGTLTDSLSGAQTDRTALGLHAGFGLEALRLSSGIEYRQDEAEQPDLTTTTRTTWLFRSNFSFQATPDSRMLGKLNHSESESSDGQFYDGGFTEAVLGYAYRPVQHNRFNALAKLTYFYNLPATDQITLKNTSAEFLQKSRIASFDWTYDIRPRWSVGGKYAYRISEVSLQREDPEFFANGAELFVLRSDWRFQESWELLLEGRVLDMRDLAETRSGALVVVSRYLGEHIKIGLGYNFTDFSDNLTDLSFDHRGAFLSVTGAM
jgi:flagellar motor protein MotB